MSNNNITTCPDVQNMNEDVRKETKLRGLLVLITGPVSFFPYDHSFISSKNMKKFKKKNMNEMLSSTVSVVEKSFDVLNTEFTLFFFCASWCKNSLIFTSTLAEFVYQHKDKCQCLAISNDHTNEAAARLCYGTGFMCLPVDHPNRSALYRYVHINAEYLMVSSAMTQL